MFVQHCKYYWTSTKQTKIKKGQDWRKVNFMEFWCAKSFFMMRRWYQSLAFLNMSLFWGNTFFFPSHERKTYIIFGSEALSHLLKTCLFLERSYLSLTSWCWSLWHATHGCSSQLWLVEGWAFILCHRWLSHMLVARRLMTALTYRLIYWPQDISNCNTCSNIINCKEGTKWSTRAIEWWLWMYDLKLCRIPSICRFLSQFSIFLQT